MLRLSRSRQENAQPLDSVEPEVSPDLYWRIFSTEFNLGLRKPTMDSCAKCKAFEVDIKIKQDPDTKIKQEGERDMHRDAAKFAYED